MELSPLLVSASGGIYYVDLDKGTYRPILPYAAALAATPTHLYVARTLNEQTRLDVHDRQGLVWMRRVPGCFDTHGVTRMPDGGFALVSTGSNEIVFLDADGREVRRWAPDPAAEFDSWHLNSTFLANGKLYCTCFGKFDTFRGYAGRFVDLGMILDVDSGKAVVQGLSAPHDPYRLGNGWMVNDSDRSRVLFVPDGGKPQLLFESTGFSRGLAVLPAHYVVGFSSIRTRARADRTSAVTVVERGTNRLVRTITMPCAEIGGMCIAPGPEVIQAIDLEQTNVHENFGLFPSRGPVTAEQRIGTIEMVGTPRRLPEETNCFEVTLRLLNRGAAIWSSCHEPPLTIGYQVLDRAGVIVADGERTPLPMPVYPGRTMTLNIRLKPTVLVAQAGAYARLTLVQETVAWWLDSPTWKTATVPVPRW
jgi:hypothetical protein